MRKRFGIDLNTIDDDPLMKRTRAEWELHRKDVEAIINSSEVQLKSVAGDNLRLALESLIEEKKEELAYINEVLERFYSDMCIKCGRLTEVSTYLEKPRNCMPCLKNSVMRVMMTLGKEKIDEARRRMGIGDDDIEQRERISEGAKSSTEGSRP